MTGAWFQVLVGASGSFIADAAGNVIDPSLFFGGDPFATSFGGVNVTLVPAPGTLALLGLGGLAMGRRRR